MKKFFLSTMVCFVMSGCSTEAYKPVAAKLQQFCYMAKNCHPGADDSKQEEKAKAS